MRCDAKATATARLIGQVREQRKARVQKDEILGWIRAGLQDKVMLGDEGCVRVFLSTFTRSTEARRSAGAGGRAPAPRHADEASSMSPHSAFASCRRAQRVSPFHQQKVRR